MLFLCVKCMFLNELEVNWRHGIINKSSTDTNLKIKTIVKYSCTIIYQRYVTRGMLIKVASRVRVGYLKE